MDRLLASTTPARQDDLLFRLAAADRALDRWRRRRRGAVEVALVASVLGWAARRAGLPRAGAISILFGVCLSVALSLAVVEWRAHRRRRSLAARLAAELRR